MEKVVSNSSSLIFLAKGDLFELAKNTFSKILIPEEIKKELFAKDSPENKIIEKEIGSFIEELKINKIKDLPIDGGEKEAISLCIEKNIFIFLSDDKKTRSYAQNLGIKVIGILGILLDNFQKKKIDKKGILKIINNLIDKGYYLSPQVYSKIIELIEKD